MNRNQQAREMAMERVIREAQGIADFSRRLSIAIRVAEKAGISLADALHRLDTDPCPSCGSTNQETIGTALVHCNVCGHNFPPTKGNT